MIYALINQDDNQVVNVIELEEGSDWAPPAGHFVEPLTTGGIGWTYSDGSFINPNTQETND